MSKYPTTVSFTMAIVLPILFFLLFSIPLFSTHITPTHASSFSQQSHIELPNTNIKHTSSQTLTHLQFYYHDIRETLSATLVQIVAAPKNVPNGFGSTFVMDDPMTEGPELGSKEIGRAQGLFGIASLGDLGMFMLTNFAFTDGAYAGSTLSMLGRNAISEQNRELPIVGGTGVFRFATGYAIANSVNSVSTPQHFVVEYNVTVRHERVG